jgi:soluble lytic murein transglycosylase
MNWYGKTIYLSGADDMKDQLLLRFPLVYLRLIQQLSQNYGIPAELILAIIRQESAFRDDIVSSAGAKGLMQLMPQTAALIAKREKIAYRSKQDLFLSSKNINLGVAYLHELAKHFHGHPLLMAAAYNAGPRQVTYWISNHPPQDIDIWIETLPWKETRNYLKNIIAFYAVYQYRMHTKPDLKIFMRPVRQG